MRRFAVAFVLVATGCGEAPIPDRETASSNAILSVPAANQAAAAPSPPAEPVLTAVGYDTIRIGAPPSAAEGYDLADDGSYQDSCRIYASERLPNTYAIVEDGRVMRLTAFQREGSGASPVRTEGGIGPGSTEAEVRAAYAPLREQPHHYVAPPAKDLFFGGSETEPGLRFEIGDDGRVTAVHAGLEPVLGYVEGCS